MNRSTPTTPPSTPLPRMSVEEARAVMWLRNNHRPLGELLDEGYLDEHRLAWAAEKAYDPELKAAAAVLLEWVRHGPAPPGQIPDSATLDESLPQIEAGLTMQQARETRWPFKDFKNRPMGELVDTQQIGLKDLGFAIENAWDERIRQAAVVLMASRLHQAVKEPAPAAGPLRIVSEGRSHSERKQLAWAAIEGMLTGALGVLIILALIRPIRALASGSTELTIEQLFSPAGLVALIILVALTAALGWLLNRLVDAAYRRMDREIENYRKGQEGEEKVVNAIAHSLDGEWTLVRNVELPGRTGGDIDGVLVGPPGVWALEIKNLAGEYRNVGEQWEYRAGSRWQRMKKSPSRQAQDNAARLATFLKADGIRQWVTAVVVWANPESWLVVDNPSVAVWTVDRLPEELGNVWQNPPMPESDRERIIEKLTRLCQRVDNEEKE